MGSSLSISMSVSSSSNSRLAVFGDLLLFVLKEDGIVEELNEKFVVCPFELDMEDI
jgi:hypothetical protein